MYMYIHTYRTRTYGPQSDASACPAPTIRANKEKVRAWKGSTPEPPMTLAFATGWGSMSLRCGPIYCTVTRPDQTRPDQTMTQHSTITSLLRATGSP